MRSWHAHMLTVGLTLALVGAGGIPAQSESLFAPAGGDLFTHTTARQVGDILTVLIAENTTASRNVGTDIEKAPKYSGKARVEGFFDILTGLDGLIEPLKSLDISPKEEFESKASTTAGQKFSGRLTVIVREVLPNGHLQVEGVRAIQINKETETLTLSGVVRTLDIAPENTVLSTQLADVEIHYTGKGVVSRSQKVGILGKLYNLLF